jgi:hypothetical protein
MKSPKQEDRPMEHDPSDMEIEQASQDLSLTEDGSKVTPKINANAHEITSDHDDICGIGVLFLSINKINK